MPRPTKRKKARSPQATEFISALQTANERGEAARHKCNLAEWQFIDPSKYECPSEEKRYLLEYELAREANALVQPYRSVATWTAVFRGHFPEKAFLSIRPAERVERLKAAFSKGGAGAPFFDFTNEWQSLSYRFRYALSPEYQARLDAITMAGCEDESVEPADHTLNAEVANFMGNLPETAFDHTVAHVQMTIRFDHSDDALKADFSDLLASLRRRDPAPGQKDELDAHLKQLAVARLHRIFDTVEASQDYLSDCGFDLPYADASGWSKARTATRKLLGVGRAANTAAE